MLKKYIKELLKRDKKEEVKAKIDLVKEWIEEEEKYRKSITMVKENYHNLGDYEGEDRAYRLYMKYKTNSIFGWPQKFFSLVGGYGTKPLRIIIAMLVTMFGFAGAYFFFLIDQFKDTLSTFWDVLYYSGITFLTIGYGDISPAFEKSMGLRFVSVAEGFIGLFLMSYLTVAVVRKLLR